MAVTVLLSVSCLYLGNSVSADRQGRVSVGLFLHVSAQHRGVDFGQELAKLDTR